jgi:hypothetical protein
MNRLNALLIARFEAENEPGKCALYVKSLDKAYRKINACCKLLPGNEFDGKSSALVLDAAYHQIKLCRNGISNAVRGCLKEVRPYS